jgi:hypothetical protein
MHYRMGERASIGRTAYRETVQPRYPSRWRLAAVCSFVALCLWIARAVYGSSLVLAVAGLVFTVGALGLMIASQPRYERRD